MRFQVIPRLRKFWSNKGHFRRFYEATASVLLFGTLAQRPELQASANQALVELQQRGYTVEGEAIRIYPAETNAAENFSPLHAGGWKPGVIRLRTNLNPQLSIEVYLRHELFHEISHRTCRDRLPIWAEEAGAMAFSGELTALSRNEDFDTASLREKVANDSELGPQEYNALANLVVQNGWPQNHCETNKDIAAQLGGVQEFGALDFILINLASGRALQEHNSALQSAPPGSLLKLLYVAALKKVDSNIARELAKSDTAALLRRSEDFELRRYFELFPQLQVFFARTVERQIDATLLGERASDSSYPVKLTLKQLASFLRSAVLSDPKRFIGLKINGQIAESTLAQVDRGALDTYFSLNGWAKTGSASNKNGKPIVGHLAVVWPAENPKYLAVFRGSGIRGAGVLARARKKLSQWRDVYTPQRANVRVRLMSLLKKNDYSLKNICPSFDTSMDGQEDRFSICGQFAIQTSARGAKPERLVSGLIEKTGDKLVLVTDPESYADGVLGSEAADLRGSAREALRAVIVWDGLHGQARHLDTKSVCDSTHCMVFKGDEKSTENTPVELLRLLDQIAKRNAIEWFHFSRGGQEAWRREISASRLAQEFNEELILSLSRERDRNGEVAFHMVYQDSEESVGCEVVRKKLNLPSCPEAVKSSSTSFIFSGVGKGHGIGLDVEAARSAAKSGASAEKIIEEAYESKMH